MVSEAILKNISKHLSHLAGQLNGSNLRARCARGGLILGIAAVLSRSFQLVRYMVLARLLLPGQLGTMAIILASTLFFETAFEVGVKQSVIQNSRGAEPGYLNAAWWFQAIRGFGLFIVAFFAAPAVSWFYNRPELTWLLRVALLALVLRGLISPGAHVLEKKFLFGRAAVLIQGSNLLGTGLTICLVFIYRDIWALVAGFVCESFLRLFISFLLCPFKPKFTIERESLTEILRFARGMLGLPVLTLVAFQSPIFLLGKLVAISLVGMYAMADHLAQTPRELFVQVFFPVLLPAFSEKQRDRRSMRSAVLQMTRATAVLGIPVVCFCVCFSGPILSAVFGRQYSSVSSAFAFLSVCTLMRTQGVTLASVYLALGRPDLHRGFVAIRAGVMVLLIYPAIIAAGPVGAAAAVLIAELSGLTAQVLWMRRRIGLGFSRYFSCWPAGLVTGLPVIICGAILHLTGITSVTVNLIAGGAVCMVCCLSGLFMLKGREEKTETVRVEPMEQAKRLDRRDRICVKT